MRRIVVFRMMGFCLTALCCSLVLAQGPGATAPPWKIWSQNASAPTWSLDVTVETPLNTAGIYEAWENWIDPANGAQRTTKRATWNIAANPNAGNHPTTIVRPTMSKAGGLSTCEGKLFDTTPTRQAGPDPFTW